MCQGEIARCQSVSAQINERRGYHRKVRHPDSHQNYQYNVAPGCHAGRYGQFLQICPISLTADQMIAFPGGDIILQHPHTQTDSHQHRRQGGGSAEIHRCHRSMSVNFRGKYFKSDPFSQCGRRSIFRKSFYKHQQCPDGIISAKQRQKYFTHSHCKFCTEHRSRFFQTGGNIQHGIFQHRQHKREHMQTHDQHQTPQGKKYLFRSCRCRQKLLKKSLFLHKKDPSHGGNIRRCHKGNHKNNVKHSVAGKPGPGKQVRQRRCNYRGHNDHQHSQHQGIPNHCNIFRISQCIPRMIEIKAAIYNDRLCKYHHYRTHDQKYKKYRKNHRQKVLLCFDRFIHGIYLVVCAA